MENSKPSVLAGLLCACAVVVTAQTGKVEVPRGDWALFLPNGEGKAQVNAYCGGSCHDLSFLMQSRKTEADWMRASEAMLSEMGSDMGEDALAASKYLGEHFGPKTAELRIPLAINDAPAAEIAVFLTTDLAAAEKVAAERDASPFRDFEDFQKRSSFIGKDAQPLDRYMDFTARGSEK